MQTRKHPLNGRVEARFSRHLARIVPALLAAVLLLVGCKTGTNGPKGPTKRIAVYNGSGVNPASATATKAALEADGRSVDLLDEGQVQAGLNDYGLVVLPNGNPLDMADALGYTGREQIRSVVTDGGGFIGIGGGAYLAADSMSYRGSGSLTTPIGFFHGLASGPIASLSTTGYLLTGVALEDQRFDTSGNTTLQVMYDGGPALQYFEALDVSTVGRFTLTSGSAIDIFEAGMGRVALSAVDLEIEENDDRDGTSYGSDLVDPESDWFVLQRLVSWCFREVF